LRKKCDDILKGSIERPWGEVFSPLTKKSVDLCQFISTLIIENNRVTPPPAKSAFLYRLDPGSGVPAYRQIIDQVLAGIASGTLPPGTQLPTVRQLAVDLTINPNTVVRAYRELEIRGVLETQQGTGTFISDVKPKRDDVERERQLDQLAADVAARTGQAGFTLNQLMSRLKEMQTDRKDKSK
jgi:GntR family transcriptional regulator